MSLRQIRQGEVYWLADCHPLGLDEAKGRPVVVVSPPEWLGQEDQPILIVPVSASSLASEQDRIKLPNKAELLSTTSGLLKICWAIPRCFALVERGRLTELMGYISGDTLRRLVTAVEVRIKDASNES